MSAIRLLRLYIDEGQSHIFHLNYEYPEFFVDELKLHFPNSKIIATVHYSYWSWTVNGDYEEFRRIMQTPASTNERKYADLIKGYVFSKKFYDKVDRLIVLCEDTFRTLYEIYEVPKEKMSIIPNGMRQLKGKNSNRKRQQIRKRYHIGEDEKIILYAGRLEKDKGILALIQAFICILKKYENCRLVIVGAGLDSNLKQTIEYSQECGIKITFTGEIAQPFLFDWYRMADIGVIPSYLEQCSYVGIEMMMHQLAIVASDAYGVRNMFREGENALIAKIGDRKQEDEFIQNLTNRILELLTNDDKRNRMASQARKIYEERYGIEKMRNASLQFLNCLFQNTGIFSLKMPEDVPFPPKI